MSQKVEYETYDTMEGETNGDGSKEKVWKN